MHFISVSFSSFSAYCRPQDEMHSASEKYSVKTRGGCGERKRRSPLIQLLVYLLKPTVVVWIIISHPFVISKMANAYRACDFGESTMSLALFSRHPVSLFPDHVCLVFA